MRIRRRPPPPPPPPPSPPLPPPAQICTDPCLQRVGTGDQKPMVGDHGMQGRGWLHLDGDPPRDEPDQSTHHHGGWWGRGRRESRDPSHTRLLHDPPPSPDPHPKMKIPHLINGRCTPSSHFKENLEEEKVDSEKIWGGEVNGGNKWSGSSSSSSSGAQLTMMMISSSPPKEKTKARKQDCFTQLGSTTAAFNSDSDQSYMPPAGRAEKLGRDGSGGAKKRRSPAVLMEGSRCSRVNGRGWRCCQQTLVGYSLCEHHLGKGRLRSMNTVRGKSKKITNAVQSLPQEQMQEQGLAQVAEPFRKKKIGMVKARSISSLLGDSNGMTIAAAAAAPDASGEAMTSAVLGASACT